MRNVVLKRLRKFSWATIAASSTSCALVVELAEAGEEVVGHVGGRGGHGLG